MKKNKIINFLENHPFFVIFGVIATFITLFFIFINTYYYQQVELLKIQKSELENRLASIRRGFDGNEYLNIEKIIIKRGEYDSTLKNSIYLSDLDIYTQKDNEELIHEKITLKEFGILFGDKYNNDDYNASNHFVHHWSTKEILKIKNAFPWENIMTSIFVNKMEIDSIWDYGIMGDSGNIIEKEYLDEKTNKKLKEILYMDPVSREFSETLSAMVYLPGSIECRNLKSKLIAAEKKGNILYTQFLLTYDNVIVNHKKYLKYYIRIEIINIAIKNYLYKISIFIPSEEPLPRDKNHYLVSQWLSNFRIISD